MDKVEYQSAMGEEAASVTHYPTIDFALAVRALKRAVMKEVRKFIEPVVKYLEKLLRRA